jgi:glycosyltransferase involved in cell wall biosynthesis
VGLIPGQVSLKNLRPFVPSKLFEYLACGIPVVASALPSIRSFHAEADWGILVEPADARAHARAIGFLLDHPAEARAKGERGLTMVEDRFNWAGEAQKLLALYDRVFTPERKGK